MHSPRCRRRSRRLAPPEQGKELCNPLGALRQLRPLPQREVARQGGRGGAGCRDSRVEDERGGGLEDGIQCGGAIASAIASASAGPLAAPVFHHGGEQVGERLWVERVGVVRDGEGSYSTIASIDLISGMQQGGKKPYRIQPLDRPCGHAAALRLGLRRHSGEQPLQPRNQPGQRRRQRVAAGW